MSQERITTLLTEKRSYLPPEHGKSSAWISAVRTKSTPSAGELWKTPMTSGVHAHRS